MGPGPALPPHGGELRRARERIGERGGPDKRGGEKNGGILAGRGRWFAPSVLLQALFVRWRPCERPSTREPLVTGILADAPAGPGSGVPGRRRAGGGGGPAPDAPAPGHLLGDRAPPQA